MASRLMTGLRVRARFELRMVPSSLVRIVCCHLTNQPGNSDAPYIHQKTHSSPRTGFGIWANLKYRPLVVKQRLGRLGRCLNIRSMSSVLKQTSHRHPRGPRLHRPTGKSASNSARHPRQMPHVPSALPTHSSSVECWTSRDGDMSDLSASPRRGQVSSVRGRMTIVHGFKFLRPQRKFGCKFTGIPTTL